MSFTVACFIHEMAFFATDIHMATDLILSVLFTRFYTQFRYCCLMTIVAEVDQREGDGFELSPRSEHRPLCAGTKRRPA